VVVRVNAELDESSVDDVKQCEDMIVNQSEVVLSSSTEDEVRQTLAELDKILRPLGLETNLVVIRRANSLAIYFVCLTLSALKNLRDQWSNGQLTDIVRSVCTLLSGASREVCVKRLTWQKADFERCLKFFEPLEGEQ